MEPKNLAIIFGPSIIRTPNDTLDIAVKDMKHQCRIVELLLTHYDYFFENGKTPDIEDVCGNNLAASTSSSATGVSAAQQQQEDQTNMLLHNISKIERFTESSSCNTTSRSRFMPQLGKKIRKPGDSRVSEIKSKSFHTSTSNSITNTNTKHSITTPILLTTITKNTLKNFYKSTPNISTLKTRSISNHNRNASKIACESAAAYRQRRKAVPTIYDFGVTLRLHFQSNSAATTTTSSSSSSSTTVSTTKKTSKKNENRSILGHRHGRKTSLDEKDSGSCSGSSATKEQQRQRNSVDISITLTDDESSNSRLSDTGSMSLGAVTDALEDKLKIFKYGSESNDENGSPDYPITPRRYTIGEPLLLHSENIPYADESPERHFHNFCPLDNITGNNLMVSRSCASTNTLMNAKMNNEKPTSMSTGSTLTTTYKTTHKLQHSATAPINSSLGSVGGLTSPPTAASTPTSSSLKGNLTASTARNLYATSKNLRFSSSVQEQRCSEDDSEGSTTSDPKEALIMASPSFLLDKYNKKRRDHRLFRSASFNCRNYSSRYGGAATGGVGSNMPATGLTKDEKTDMNLTKKRQIQNKQNRSIKRRHTVGGPHDYSGNGAGSNNCNHHCKNITNNAANNSTASNNTTAVVRRIPLSSANSNIPNNNNNNNNNMQHDEGGSSSSTSNGNNSSSSNSSSSTNNAATVNVANSAGEHVLEVGIRIKNINRGRF